MTYPAEITADTPAFYWQMHETSGTNLDDTTANNRDGTLWDSDHIANTGVTLSYAGARSDGDLAVLFNGTGYVRTSYVGWATGMQVTLEIIYKKTGGSGFCSLFTASNAGSMFGVNGNDVVFFPDTGSSSENWVGASPGTGIWTHLALRYDDSARTAEVLVNAVSKGLHTGIVPLASGSNGNRVMVANRGDFGFEYLPWIGGLDEAAWYSTLVSNTRLTAHVNALAPASTTGRERYNPGSGYTKKPSKRFSGSYAEKPYKTFKSGSYAALS